MRIVKLDWSLRPAVATGFNETTAASPAIVANPPMSLTERVMGAWLDVPMADDKRLCRRQVRVSWEDARSISLSYQFRRDPGPEEIQARINVVLTEGPERYKARRPPDNSGSRPILVVPPTESPTTGFHVFPIGIGGYARFGQQIGIGWVNAPVAEILQVTLKLTDTATRTTNKVAWMPTFEARTSGDFRAWLPWYPPVVADVDPRATRETIAEITLDAWDADFRRLQGTATSRRFYLRRTGRMFSSFDLNFWAIPQPRVLMPFPGLPPSASLLIDDAVFVKLTDDLRVTPGARLDASVFARHDIKLVSSAPKEDKTTSHPEARVYGWWR
jgi:hypothetical protein